VVLVELEVAVMVSVKQGEGKELNTDVTYLSHSCGAYFIRRRQFLFILPSHMVSPLIFHSSLVSTPCLLSTSTAKHLPHYVWEIKGQVSMQNRALRDSKKKSINSGN